MSLKVIKNKIRATERTGKVAKAMEAVSAVKMRKSQERALHGRSYAGAALRILAHISAHGKDLTHPLMEEGNEKRVGVVVITSDKGLAGNLNNAVLKEVHRVVDAHDKESVVLLCLGRKGYEHFKSRGYNVVLHRINISDDVSLTDMEDVVEKSIDLFLKKEVGRVYVAYQNFISTFQQEAHTRQLFPLDTSVLSEIADTLQGEVEDAGTTSSPYTLEPDSEALLNSVLPHLARIVMYHTMLEHKASEHSARMVAMKNATDKAKEVAKALTLRFNKERQAVITREVSEITGGIEALKD